MISPLWSSLSVCFPKSIGMLTDSSTACIAESELGIP